MKLFPDSSTFFGIEDLDEFLKGNYKAIVLIRDPRDVYVSRVYWHTNLWQDPGPHGRPLNGKIAYLDPQLLEYWNQSDFHDKLTMTLAHQLPLPFSQVNREYELAGLALSTGRGYLVKFEDLVGNLGGGSNEIQDRTIREMLAFFKRRVPEASIRCAGELLFGNSATFRQGMIGSWKNHFQPDHILLCKMTMGQTLIDWGYETGYDW